MACGVARALDAEGPLAALALLNARTRYRFTGIFQVDPPHLRNIFLIDRENPEVNVSGAVTPVESGYCGLACSALAPFATRDARKDVRLSGHPARCSVISYAGVPIVMPGGRPWGALCHFDGRPRILPASEIPLLEAVTPHLAEWLLAHAIGRVPVAD